jgi:hypothetical protein
MSGHASLGRRSAAAVVLQLAFIVGLASVVVHATVLDTWGAIGGIVGGAIAAALLLSGILLWLAGRARPWRVRYSGEGLRTVPYGEVQGRFVGG